MKVVRKNGLGKLFVICLMLGLFLGFGSLTMPAAASAEMSVTVTGDGVANPMTFTQADLEAMEQVQAHYSTINTWPIKKIYMAEGVRLADLLEQAGIKAEAKLIYVKATDGYNMTFTRKELLDDPRHYYPGLKDNDEYSGHILGSPDGAEEVDAILALKSVEGNDEPSKMNDSDAPVLIMGQRWVTEQTNNAFVKKVGTIEVSTELPAKWDAPVATPAGGTVPAGTEVELSTSDMDGDNIHYTTDGSTPTFKSPMYNWIKKRWWNDRSDVLATINRPIDVSQDMTIKAVAIGFGKEDSDIVTFNYQVPLKLELVKAEVTNKGDVSFTCNKAMADPTGVGAEGQFTVLVDGQKVDVTAVVKTNIPEKIKLELATKVKGGQDVTVAYTKSDEEGKQIKSSDESVLESFSAQATNNLAAPSEKPQYNVLPVADAIYTIAATADGIKTMTVNADQTGFKYFTVSVEPVTAHEGEEAVVFTQLRNDVQLRLNATVADFDEGIAAKAGFDVKPGDVIKAYIVDRLTNDINSNPVVLQ